MTAITRTIRGSFTSQIFEERISKVLFSTFALLAVLYAYGIISTVTFVLERRSYENETKAELATLSEKEAQYLALLNTLTIEKATSLGLSVTKNVQYVAYSAGRQNLSLNTLSYER